MALLIMKKNIFGGVCAWLYEGYIKFHHAHATLGFLVSPWPYRCASNVPSYHFPTTSNRFTQSHPITLFYPLFLHDRPVTCYFRKIFDKNWPAGKTKDALSKGYGLKIEYVWVIYKNIGLISCL